MNSLNHHLFRQRLIFTVRACLLTIVFFVLPGTIFAQVRVWSGAGMPGNWADPNNWGGDVPDTPTETAQITVGGPVVITTGIGTTMIQGMIVGVNVQLRDPGATLTITTTLTIGSSLTLGDAGTTPMFTLRMNGFCSNTFPVSVEANARLVVGSGATWNNNNTLTIQANGELEIQDNGSVAIAAVTYASPTSILRYTGTIAKTTTNQELNAIMPGSLIVQNTTGVTLNNSTDVQGLFQLAGGGIIVMNAFVLTLSGNIDFSGGTITGDLTSSQITIAGAGSITGNLAFTGGARSLSSFYIHRSAAVVNLGSDLEVGGATGSLGMLDHSNSILNTNGFHLQLQDGMAPHHSIGIGCVLNVQAGSPLEINLTPSGTRGFYKNGTVNILTGGTVINTGDIFNNGPFTVAANGILRLVDNGNVNTLSTIAVTYLSPTARIEYTGSVATAVTNFEIPTTMPGHVNIANTGGVSLLNALYTFQSALSIQVGATLSLFAGGSINAQGALDLFGNIRGNPVSNFSITGSGGITSTLKFVTSLQLNDFSINRPGANLTLGTQLDVGSSGGILNLTAGIITTSGANYLYLVNSAASALTGGNAASYINGPLRRDIPSIGPFPDYLMPVGKSGTYYPLTVVNPSPIGPVALEVEAYNVHSGGTAPLGSTGLGNEYWRATNHMASPFAPTMLLQRTTPAMIPGNYFCYSNTVNGVYTGSIGIVSGATIQGSAAIANAPAEVFLAIGATIPAATVVSRYPARNSHNATGSSNVNVTFNKNVTAGSVTGIKISGHQTGYRSNAGTFSGGGSPSLTFDPTKDFRPGELVSVTVDKASVMATDGGVMINSEVHQYRARAGVGPGTFYRTSEPLIGSNPVVLCTGDVDGDGDLDIAVNNSTGVVILLNNGNAGFSPAPGSPFAAGVSGPVTFGDLDNDGDLDLTATNSSTGVVHILLNNGSGSFSISGTVVAGATYPVQKLGDMNGDGYLDIITANNNGNNISVMINNGAGTFALLGNYTTGGTIPNGIDLGDIDNDGDLDVVVTNNGTNTVATLFNNGLGVFFVPTTFAGGWTTPTSVALGDIDNDGDLDLAAVDSGGNAEIRLNNGLGNFATSAPGSPYTVVGANNSPFMILLEDVDGDGDLDLINAGHWSNTVEIRLNSGSGNFTTIGLNSPIPVGTSPYGIVAGDVDGDGDLDLATANLVGGTVSILRNAIQPAVISQTPARNTNTGGVAAPASLTWNQSMTTATTTLIPSARLNIWGGFTGYRSNAAAMNGGGTATTSITPTLAFRPGEEIMVTVTSAQSTQLVPSRPYVYKYRTQAGVGPGTFVQTREVNIPTGGVARSLADFNADGYLDALCHDNTRIYIRYGSANGFLTELSIPGPTFVFAQHADVNNDGREDILANTNSEVLVYLNNGAGFNASISHGIANTGVRLLTADFNGDGFMDFAIPQGGVVHIYRGNGTGTFALHLSTPSVGGSINGFGVADMDNDGDMDLVVNNTLSNLYVLANGFTSFYPLASIPSASATARLSLADMDNDGDNDVVLYGINVGNGASVFRNNGAGMLGSAEAILPYTGQGTVGGTIGDFDGDGDLDVTALELTSSTSMYRVWTAINNGNAVFATPVPMPRSYDFSYAPLAGDVDNDGDIDLVVSMDVGTFLFTLTNMPLPALTANPTIVNFGAVTVGQTKDIQLTLTGTQLYQPTTISVTGATVATIAQTSSPFATTATITVNQTPTLNTTLFIRFAPTTTGTTTGSLIVTSSGATLTVSFTGIGLEPQPPPFISGLSSTIASIGSLLVINGFNFQGASSVVLGGIPLSNYTVLSSTQISISVPQGLSGITTASLSITTPGGMTTTTSSLTIVPPPVITNLSTYSGVTGNTISIYGANFTYLTAIQFGLTNATYTVHSPSLITVTVPPSAFGAAAVQTISVITAGGISTSMTAFVYAQPAQLPPPPIVTGFAPLTGSTGTTITLTGTNLAGATVSFGGIPGTVLTNTGNEVIVVIPPGISTANAMMSITTPGGTTVVPGIVTLSPEQLPPPPTITAISSTIATAGQQLTLTGTYLQNILQVVIGSTVRSTFASYTYISNTTLTMIVPSAGVLATTGSAASITTVTITVLTQGGTAISPLLTVVAPPIITDYSPLLATAGTLVTLNGRNFFNASKLTVAGVQATITMNTGNQVTFIMPATSASQTAGIMGYIRITTPGGTATTATFINSTDPPIISSFEPQTTANPGDVITINGINLHNVQTVLLNGVAASNIEILSPTQIRVMVSNNASRRTSGPIELQGANGSSLSKDVISLAYSLEKDSTVALSLFQNLDGANWKQQSNWNSSAPITSWSGLSVQNNRITGFVLPNNNLKGAVPPALGSLRALRTLDLSNNGLTGNLSTGALADSLKVLTELESVNLSGNVLTGNDLNLMCIWKNLRLLNISRNNIEAPIPSCLETLNNLQFLDISRNRFFGTIPKELGKLTGIKTINVSFNNLTGALPRELGARILVQSNAKKEQGDIAALSGLTVLQVANNKLSGFIPDELGNLTTLDTLDLSANTFVGSLPESLTKLKNLKFCSIERNTFRSMPDLSLIRGLEILRVGFNQLDFASLEPNIKVETYSFIPQDSVFGKTLDTLLPFAKPAKLPIQFLSGSQNTYQWFKEILVTVNGFPRFEWTKVNTQTSATLTFSSFSQIDSGKYECRVTNSLLPGLTFYSRPYIVRPFGSVPKPTLAVELLSPPDSARYVLPQPTLSWRSLSSASFYTVELDTVPTFQSPVIKTFVTAVATDTTTWEVPAQAALKTNTRYYWRVRAENGGGSGLWSLIRTFKTITDEVEVVISEHHFGKVLIDETATVTGYLQNIGKRVVTITNIGVSDKVFKISALKNISLTSGQKIPLEIQFTPTSVNDIRASVTIETAGNLAATAVLEDVLRGSGAPVSIQNVDMDTVRVGRTTLATTLAINRSNEEVTIKSVRMENEAGKVFSFGEVDAGIVLGAGDTLALPLRCTPDVVGRLRGKIVIETEITKKTEIAEGRVVAVSRLPNPDDIVLEPKFSALSQNVSAGNTIELELSINNATPTVLNNIFSAGTPLFEGYLSFDRRVLVKPNDTNTTVRILRNQAPNNRYSLAAIAPSFMKNGSASLVRFRCLVVLGDTTVSRLNLLSLQWGDGNRSASGKKVFVELPTDSELFTTLVCRIDGAPRLIRNTNSRLVIQQVRPNPVVDELFLQYSLREPNNVLLEMVNVQGQHIKTFVHTSQSAGEHQITANISDIASGIYTVILRTATGIVSERVVITR